MVALPTAQLPHTHFTFSFPIYGIADSRFLLNCTFPPQNDICPHVGSLLSNDTALHAIQDLNLHKHFESQRTFP